MPLKKKSPAGNMAQSKTHSKSHHTKFSDELCDGDKDDDRQLEDEADDEDHIVDENGYVQLRNYKYSDELANGDESDDKDIHEDEDMNDDVVDVNGQTNAGYGSKVMSDFVAGNHIMSGSHITEPRMVQLLQLDEVNMSKGQQQAGSAWGSIMDQSAIQKETDAQLIQLESQLAKYSDELANGDESDDKDIHEDEDMNDDVVDVNGHTNAGYGSKTMSDFVAGNHIMEGSHITEPRLLQVSHKHHAHHHRK